MNEMTLDDLIQFGVHLHEARVAREQAERVAEQQRLEQMRAEAIKAASALIPPAALELAKAIVPDDRCNHVTFIIRLPSGGEVSVHAYLHKGDWKLARFNRHAYKAMNPQGHYNELATLEEALAYAAGKLRP